MTSGNNSNHKSQSLDSGEAAITGESDAKCEACGGLVPADAPYGLCPRCLFAEGIAGGEKAEESR